MGKRLIEIDIATGIAMCLVVFGHMMFLTIGGIHWYEMLRYFIYQFHMEVFLFLNGFLFFYTKDIDSSIYSHWKFIREKLLKFSKPFLFFAVIYYLKELIFASSKYQFLSQYKRDLYYQFLEPVQAYPAFLWFIYVLFLMYLSIPLLAMAFPKKFRIALLIPGIFLMFFKLPAIFSLDLYGNYFIFYIFGMLYAYNKLLIDKYLMKYGIIFSFLFVSCFVYYAYTNIVYMYLTSFLSVPAILYLSNKISKNSFFLQKIGKLSFTIYIQNTTIIGLMYLFMHFILGFKASVLQFFIPLFFISAFLFPMLLNQIIPKKHLSLRSALGYL